ncbi:MAG: adenosylhomocysteinase [Acidimicrobiia bacterium]|nr:adenosylhomocysteinase [Acidimicrobiia bacterium]MYE73584.1 adenosylhomocysteinase [Acidimicrobiia bacterium]MYJ62331.1 adenosylhomocysteinase [Acidimicrobiia bacterium]
MGDARGRIAWTSRHMPLVASVAKEFSRTRPFDGLRIGLRIHLEPKTAVLIDALIRGGAQVTALGNVGTTQFDTVAELKSWGCEVLDRPDDDARSVAAHLKKMAAMGCDLLLDNGAELIVACIEGGRSPLGATEETTSGAILLREQYAQRVQMPVIVINDSPLKSIVENKYGVGESVIDAVVGTTNISLHAKVVVVFGYGWCGRGVAQFAAGRGANVVVVDPDPVKLLEAAMDGFGTASATEAARIGHVFITATGRESVVDVDLIRQMRDGAVLANAGHTDREITVSELKDAASATTLEPSLTRYDLAADKSVFVIADGQIVNLAAQGSRGNSIESMDLGFTLQARSLELLATHSKTLPLGPHPVPEAINHEVALAVLEAMQSPSRY